MNFTGLFLILFAILLLAVYLVMPTAIFGVEEPEFVVMAHVNVDEFKATSSMLLCPDRFYFDEIRGGCISQDLHYHLVPIYYIQPDQIVEYCGNRHAGGCYNPNDPTIYLIEGYEGATPSSGGCNITWHELGHAMGKTHSWMQEHWPNDKCKTVRT